MNRYTYTKPVHSSCLAVPTAVLLGLLVLLAGNADTARAHETDQFTVPANREFADVGKLISRWAYDTIQEGIDSVNKDIKDAVESGNEGALKHLHSDQAVAPAVRKAFPWAMDVIEGWEKRFNDRATWNMYPGKVLIYKEQFNNIMKNSHFFLDPRQIMRLWLSGTFKAFGVYIGSDKIGHFTDMGFNYWKEFNKARGEGADEQEAVKRAVGVGTRGLLFSERGFVGYMTAGAYSNGDMASNFLGFCFYRNLTEPLMLKGELRKPMLVLDGQFWKFAPHINRDNFFALFISDHLDEALNPSHYEAGMRPKVREQIAIRVPALLEHYRDEHGQRRSHEWFAKKHEDLRTYYGQYYGHHGPREELNRLADIAFAPAQDGLAGSTLLAAVNRGDVAAVRSLMGNRAAVNEPLRAHADYNSDWGATPLHLAARDGRADVARELLAAGAQVNAPDDNRTTPLHRAVANGNLDLVSTLLARGADANAADARGQTALHWAAIDRETDAQSQLLFILLRHGANPNVKDREGRSPLHRAAHAANSRAVSALLGAGAKPDAADQFNVTPLHLAASVNALEVTRLLMSRGAAVNARDDFGSTPLLDASRTRSRQVVAALLEGGADPTLGDAYGHKPIDIARSHNSTAITQLLARNDPAERSRPAGSRVTPSGRLGAGQ